MPMQDRQHMTYEAEDGVAASRVGQRDDAEADLRLGALKDPRAQSSRKELGTEADGKHGHLLFDTGAQPVAFGCEMRVGGVVESAHGAAHDNQAGYFVGAGVPESPRSIRRTSIRPPARSMAGVISPGPSSGTCCSTTHGWASGLTIGQATGWATSSSDRNMPENVLCETGGPSQPDGANLERLPSPWRAGPRTSRVSSVRPGRGGADAVMLGSTHFPSSTLRSGCRRGRRGLLCAGEASSATDEMPRSVVGAPFGGDRDAGGAVEVPLADFDEQQVDDDHPG